MILVGEALPGMKTIKVLGSVSAGDMLALSENRHGEHVEVKRVMAMGGTIDGATLCLCELARPLVLQYTGPAVGGTASVTRGVTSKLEGANERAELLRLAAQYATWLEMRGAHPSLATFVEDFKYREPDARAKHRQIMAIWKAAS